MNNKPNLKIWFTDFWPGFNTHSNFFADLLSEKYNLIFNEKNPDVLFFSTFGTQFLDFNCLKIFFTGEQILPNFKLCDYSLSFEPTDSKRNYRLPLYLLYGYYNLTQPRVNYDDFKKQNRKFCNFVFSNGKCKIRNDFFLKLSKYKKVDSGGRFWNNIGGPVDNKGQFLSEYKFTIAFENESHTGYTTEKIVEPMLANSIPIYWGNPSVSKDFNSKSFINYFDHNSMNDLIEKIIHLDNNDKAYEEYYNQPFLIGNKIPEQFQKHNILQFLDAAITNERLVKGHSASEKILYKADYYKNSQLRKLKQKIRAYL